MPPPSIRPLVALTAACLTAATGCAALGPGTAPAPGSPTRAEVEQLLGQVRVVEKRPHPGGYERGCKDGQACVFGESWTDASDAPGGRDGCDTRNNVLAAQLEGVRFRPGTRNCVVEAGGLADPYTGAHIAFDRADARAVQIDHVFPLAAAWDLGAAAWPQPRRVRFANDVTVNLVATSGAVNQAKSDGTPGEWLPPAASGHCFYAGKYLTVAVDYDLPVTAADSAALRDIAGRCR
ncbi:HNH endonuclease family protein [Nocardia sp. NPDC057353]|uniref:HNH endonuclease family protein n=1 Tax=Nocardia sp. NPDC057353 TaxID=3346104 RepID=UPI00363FD09B